MTFLIQKALQPDLDYLTLADLRCGAEEDGIEEPPELKDPAAFQAQRVKIGKFIHDDQKVAWIGWTADQKPAGMLLCRFRDKSKESPEIFSDGTAFGELDPAIFPHDGRFVEIFQLWVEPEYRRMGLATQLKRHVEIEAARHSIGMIYTHTRETNLHILELNHRLGYEEVRKGPIWDDVIRVSLVKYISIKEN